MAELGSKNSPSVMMPASSPSFPPPSPSSSRPSHVWTTDSLFEDYLTIRLPFPSLSNLRSLIDELKEEFCPADSTLTISDLSYFSADRLGVRLDANLRFEDLDKGFKRRAYQICNLKNLCEKANLFFEDAGAKDDLNRIFYVLNESYNKIKGDSLLYHLLDEVRTIVIPSQFQYEHVLNFDATKLSSFQKLLVFVSRELRTAQFRMINDCLHEQIVMERVVTDEEGEPAVEYELTHAWKPAETKTLRDFLNAKIQRETNWEMWVHFTNPHDNGDKLISHLTITDQLDCPKLKRNRYLWSWRDGLYNAQYDMFFPFSRRQEWSRLAEEIQTHRLSLGWEGYVCLPPTNLDVAVTFFDRDFGLEISPETETEGGERWYDPSLLEATKFESILTTQKLSPETIDFVYMMLARLFFPVNQLDKWQVVLFIKGVAGSGKSTIAQLVRSLYPKECVTTLSSNMERQFGLSAIYSGLICVCSEVREDFALDQGEFQQIISGEEVQISVKNKTAFSHVWETPLLLLGNQLFKYSDASGSITRRIAMIEFNEQVKKSQSDPLLMEKLQTELSIVMRKGVWLYHKFVRTHARADFWSFAPPQMREFHNNVRSAVDTLVSFLESKCLTFGNNHDIHFMPLSDFKQMYFSHVIRDGGAKPQWKRDHYQTVFNENNLYIETKRRKRTYQGVDMVCEWVFGCCPLDTGDSANAMMQGMERRVERVKGGSLLRGRQRLDSSLVQELRRLDASGSSDPIHIHIQSYGGEISPMFYVLDCIDSLSSSIWTYVDGYAASAATLLSVYGEKRFMSKRSFILIHQLRGGLFGTHAEMMAGTEFNSRQNEIMKEVYLKRTLLSDQQIETLFRKDVWLPASSCLKHGIVDGIVNGETRREEGDETKVATRKTREGRRTRTIPFATKEGWNPVSPLL